MADHDTPDPTAQKAPEPLVSAEMARTLIVAGVAAAGAAPLADGVLAVVIPIGVAVVGGALSWGLTMLSRGRVWALRKGVDVDYVIDEAQRRTQGAV